MVFLPSFIAYNSLYLTLLPHTHLFICVKNVPSFSLKWCLQRKAWGQRARGGGEGTSLSLLEEPGNCLATTPVPPPTPASPGGSPSASLAPRQDHRAFPQRLPGQPWGAPLQCGLTAQPLLLSKTNRGTHTGRGSWS